jgi:hypothetical protein
MARTTNHIPGRFQPQIALITLMVLDGLSL